MLDIFQIKFNKSNVKESHIPIEALYNNIVNKVKLKELQLGMKPKEFTFKSVDNIHAIKSVEPYKHPKDKTSSKIMANRLSTTSMNQDLK